MAAFSFITDTLRNLASGLMSERDKVASNEFYFNDVHPDELEAMYRGDWMAGKAVDIPAFDSVREWRNWQASADQIETLEAEEKRLNLQAKLLLAMVYGRLYGGAALFMGVGTDDPTEELNPERVGQGDLKYVHVLTRYDLSTNEMRRNPEDPWFGEPVNYTLATDTGAHLTIHPSRIITFTGNRKPQRSLLTDPWGDSILARVRDALNNAALSGHAVAQMLTEAKLDVLKIPQLMSAHLATADSTERLRTRLATAMSLKSSVNALVLDKEEEYEQKQISFAQLPETLQQYLLIVSGAVDIPATRFLGQSPGGLNSTGDSDLKNYYDRIGAEQRLTLSPRLSRLDEVLIRSAHGTRDDAIHYAWPSLYQTSEKEHAEIEKSRSETFKNYANMGLLNDGVLAKVLETVLIESGQYPGLENALEEFKSTTESFDPDADDDPANGLETDPDALVDPNADPDEEVDPKTGKPVKDAAPRTLYVYRKVLNGKALVAWAKRNGFKSTLKASDMHVTIAFSRTPVDWMKAGSTWYSDKDGKLTIPAGGPRVVEPLGPKGAVVLHFASNDLVWRHEDIKRSTGAEWEWDDFQPHITIAYEGAEDVDLSAVKPFSGKIELGPELFEEVVEDWAKKLQKDGLVS